MNKTIATLAAVAALVAAQAPAYAASTDSTSAPVVKQNDNAARSAGMAANAAQDAASSARNAADTAAMAAADTTRGSMMRTQHDEGMLDPATIPTAVPQGSINTADLMDHPVRTPGGDEIANIESFVMAPDGHVQYVVLGFGGFLGIGEKDVMLPWADFTIDRQNNLLRADLTKAQVERMPQMASR